MTTMADLVGVINQNTTNFEAVGSGAVGSPGWRMASPFYESTIRRFSDDTPSSQWDRIQLEAASSGVMSYNHPPVTEQNIRFVNDPQEQGYFDEIGNMGVKLNASRAAQ